MKYYKIIDCGDQVIAYLEVPEGCSEYDTLDKIYDIIPVEKSSILFGKTLYKLIEGQLFSTVYKIEDNNETL